MGAGISVMLLGPALVLFALWLACVVLGIHGLLLGRLPGRWLPRHVTQPRVWGSGALLLAVGGLSSPSLAVIGIGLVALGHVMKPTP